MVVIETLRHVQDLALGDALAAQPPQHVFEVAQIRLVRSDIFRRHHAVEADAELAGRERKAFVIHIREDVELVVALEVAKCGNRIGERLPRTDGRSERHALRPGRRRIPVFAEAFVHDRQNLRVLQRRREALLLGLVQGVVAQQLHRASDAEAHT